MSLIARSLLALTVLLASPGAAQSPSGDATAVQLRIEVKEQNEVVLVTEARIFPMTVRVEKKDWVNCKASRTPPFTEFIRSAGTRTLFTSSAEEQGKPWRCHVSTSWNRGAPSLEHVERCAFALPFVARSAVSVLQGFDGQPTHQGTRRHALDFAMPEGTPVLAARDGVVDYVLDDAHGNDRPEGNEVLLLHADGSHSGYAHLQRGSVSVKPGDVVTRGTSLARSGRTSSQPIAPHVHFEVFAWQTDGRTSIPFELRLPDGSCRVPAEGERL